MNARSFLLAALGRVAAGGDIERQELDHAFANPRALSKAEKAAWEELSHWAGDGDIRERDARYEAFKREWVRKHMTALARGDA